MTRSNLKCNVEDSLLVVVDVQTKLTAAMPIKVLARLQKYTSIVLKGASMLNVPVIASEQYPKGLGSLEPEIGRLLTDNSTVIDKTCFSCVDSKHFMETIEKSGRKQIIVVGMEAHMCVSQTVMDLLEKDYIVFVAMDAICSRRRENYDIAIKRMGDAGAIITDSESVVFEWLRDANHEHFKYFSSMVR